MTVNLVSQRRPFPTERAFTPERRGEGEGGLGVRSVKGWIESPALMRFASGKSGLHRRNRVRPIIDTMGHRRAIPHPSSPPSPACMPMRPPNSFNHSLFVRPRCRSRGNFSFVHETACSNGGFASRQRGRTAMHRFFGRKCVTFDVCRHRRRVYDLAFDNPSGIRSAPRLLNSRQRFVAQCGSMAHRHPRAPRSRRNVFSFVTVNRIA